MRVLIVDDVATNLILLRKIVEKIEGCAPVVCNHPIQGLEALRAEPVDLILVDYRMPEMNGIDFIRWVRRQPDAEEIPTIMVTTSEDRDVRLAALDAGATEFLNKPVDVAEVQMRVRNMLRLREAQCALKNRATWLESEVRKATAALAAREEEIIHRLSRAAEHRDTDTGRHIVRMAHYCRLIAEALGLDRQKCHEVYLAAPMHDIGKIAVSDSILLKPGALTPEERSSMQRHTTQGYNILAESESTLIQTAAEIARCHHERWDGGGYPRSLRGTQIPLLARIAAVADVFDALTSNRPYKPAWPPEEARAYLAANSGQQFDPQCVNAFLSRWDAVLSVCAMRDGDASEFHPRRVAAG